MTQEEAQNTQEQTPQENVQETTQTDSSQTQPEQATTSVDSTADTTAQTQADSSAQASDTTQNTQDTTADATQNPQDSTQADTTPTTPITPATPSSDILLSKIEEELLADEGFIEKIKLTLLAIAEVYKAFTSLEITYQTTLIDIEASIKKVQEIKEYIEGKKIEFDTIVNFINQSLEDIANTHKTALSIFAQTESLLDEAKAEHSAISADLDSAKEALAKIAALELKLESIQELINQITALIATGEALKAEINALVPNILNEVKANLQADKERYEKELESKKDEYIALFDGKIATLDEKVAAFEADYLVKERVMQEALAKIEEFLAKLEAYKLEVAQTHETNLNELNTTKDAHLQALQTFKDEKQTELQTFKDTKQEELEAFKLEKIEQIQAFKDGKQIELQTFKDEKYNELLSAKDNHLSEMKVFSEDYLREINAHNNAQILELRDLFYQITSNTQQLGSNYQSITLTTSQTFTLIDGVRDYFVFIRGGTGGSYNNNAGGISSFGSYFSASGGAGNNNGAGQRGEAKAGFVNIPTEDSVQVSVSSGGVCIISWAGNMESKLDTSFLSDSDAKYLGASVNLDGSINKDEWIQAHITTRADEAYYRNIIGLEVSTYPIDETNIAHIKKENGDVFESVRELEIAIAKEYLDTNTAISEIVARYAQALNKEPETTPDEPQPETPDETPQEPQPDTNTSEGDMSEGDTSGSETSGDSSTQEGGVNPDSTTDTSTDSSQTTQPTNPDSTTQSPMDIFASEIAYVKQNLEPYKDTLTRSNTWNQFMQAYETIKNDEASLELYGDDSFSYGCFAAVSIANNTQKPSTQQLDTTIQKIIADIIQSPALTSHITSENADTLITTITTNIANAFANESFFAEGRLSNLVQSIKIMLLQAPPTSYEELLALCIASTDNISSSIPISIGASGGKAEYYKKIFQFLEEAFSIAPQASYTEIFKAFMPDIESKLDGTHTEVYNATSFEDLWNKWLASERWFMNDKNAQVRLLLAKERV